MEEYTCALKLPHTTENVWTVKENVVGAGFVRVVVQTVARHRGSIAGAACCMFCTSCMACRC